jgi:Lrp/AsnC family transcriptional regulator, leucine-responsive regulatory protein
MTQLVALDKIDRRILKILQEDNQLTNLELAERVHLSPPTCLRRVRRLRADGVIVEDVSLIDPLKVGRSLFALVEVVLERQSEEDQLAFERKMQQADEVMQCYMVSGHADFIIVVQVADMPAYHGFVRRTLTNDANIRNFRSLFAMNRTKFRTAITLDEE